MPWPPQEPNGDLQVHKDARIIQSQLASPNVVDVGSGINRSSMGRYTTVGAYSYIVDATVGNYCMIGSRCTIGGFEHPTDWLSVAAFQWGDGVSPQEPRVISERLRANPKPKQARVEIGSDVWIGSNACIRSGTRIEHGAVIGMGSVVTKDIPPFAIAVGNPARILRYRFPPPLIQRLLETEWWDLSLEQLYKLPFSDVESCLRIIESHMHNH